MRLFFLFLLLFLMSFGLKGRGTETKIEGIVIDKSTREPLPGVNILYDDDKGTITNHEGKFTVSIDCNFSFIDLQLSYVGYSTLVRRITPNQFHKNLIIIELEKDIRSIDEVVITAGNSEQRVAELSVSMAKIQPIELLTNHITNAEDAVQRVQGVEILDGQANIRGGSGYSYGAGSRVQVLVNGLPITSADAGDVKWQFLPIDNIKRIEIIKGASSVLYGSSALNGVINILTDKPQGNPEIKIRVNAGLYDAPKNKNWKWWNTPRSFSSTMVSWLGLYGRTSLSSGVGNIYDMGYRKNNGDNNIKFYLDLNRQTRKSEDINYGIRLNGLYADKTSFILWQNAETGALIQNPQTVLNLHSSMISFDPYFISEKSKKTKHYLQGRYQLIDNYFPSGKNNNSQAISTYAEYRFHYLPIERLELSSGIVHQSNTVNSHLYGNHSGYNAALFFQVSAKITERLKSVLGIRSEYNELDNISDEIHTVLRAGLNYRVADYTWLRASFGQGYRYPSVAEKYASTNVGGVMIFPNEEIRPESGWSAEAGLKQGFKTNIFEGMFDIAAFWSENKDLIEYVFGIYPDPKTDSSVFAFRTHNVENARVYGFETEISMKFKSGFWSGTFKGGYTYLYPVEFNAISGKSTKEFLKYRYQHSVKVDVSTTWHNISAGIFVTYKSKMLDVDNVFINPFSSETILPGFSDYWYKNNKEHFVADVTWGYSISSSADISIQVKNVFNEEYLGRPGDIRPPRTFEIQFLYAFSVGKSL